MFTSIIHFAQLLVRAIVAFSLLLPAALYFAYCIKKAIAKPLPESEETADEKDYAILVVINGEARNCSSLCRALLQLNYTNYLVYVVMNKMGMAAISSPHEKIIILHPPKPFADAMRTHRYAIENFRRPHTHLAILGSNCIADSEYLTELNVFFNQGYQAVQGLCVRQKHNTAADVIHSIGRLCNRFFYGEVCFALGASARLDEGGSAFFIPVYKQCLKSANAAGVSLSRALQYKIAGKGHRIAFAPKAVLYHQPALRMHTLATQHAKSTNGWIGQFGAHVRLCAEGINGRCLNRFLFGFLLLQPPVLTGFLAGVFCWLIALRTNPAAAMLWIVCLAAFPAYFAVAALHLRADLGIKKLLGGASHSTPYPVTDLYEAEVNEMYKIAT